MGIQMADHDPDPSSLTTDNPVIREARKRFDRCSEWEGVSRQRFIEDVKFTYGDSDNGYQWPNEVRNARDGMAKPCLTMNIIRQHCKMISNEARKNKSSVKFLGMGNGATQEAANVYSDLMRHIEYQSQAQTAFTIARDFAIAGGIGWFRLVTRYEGPDTFDQDIFIEPVNDPLMVFMDPDVQQRNTSDGRFAFVFDDVDKDELEEVYPEVYDLVGAQPLGLSTVSGDWIGKHKVRVCEYFRKVPKRHQLVSFVHHGLRHNVRRGVLDHLVEDSEHRNRLLSDPQTRIRDVMDHEIEWYLIAGERILDQTTWVGRYIPLIRVIGEETVIDGQMDRKGHTRWMKDAQRMYNYNASSQVEFVGTQTKSPILAPVEAIEEFEEIYNTANVKNPSVLPYRSRNPENPDEPIPPPIRLEGPKSAPGYLEGMITAKEQIMMVSGQFQNQMGELGNERTGAAINARQRQSDTANFHFQDNYEDSLIYLGMQILDIIPKLYDTRRVKHIMADDGIEYDLEIDPSLREGYLQQQAADGRVIKRVLNPLVGRFEVAASVGPSMGSRRQEIVDSLTLILTQAPALTGVLGDILVKNMDFPDAQEAALRLRRMVPPMALGQGPTANEQALSQQLATLQQLLVKTIDKNAKDTIKLAGKAELRDIEAYDAETKRMAALQKLLPMDVDGLRQVIEQLVQESLSTSLRNVMGATQKDVKTGEEIQEANRPIIPGALKAPDGEWYLTDPTRKGKYLHVAPLAQQHARPGIISNV